LYLALNIVWNLVSVFVLAEQRRLQGVSRGQHADYVAMVGL